MDGCLSLYLRRMGVYLRHQPSPPISALNSDIACQIKVQDGVLDVTVNGVTQTENIFRNDSDWLNQTFYFKVGCCPQDNEGPASEGARVTFSALKVSHSGRLEPAYGSCAKRNSRTSFLRA